jgi:hypothetical protein
MQSAFRSAIARQVGGDVACNADGFISVAGFLQSLVA